MTYPDDFNDSREIIALVGSSDGSPVLEGILVVDFDFAMDPSALGEFISGDHTVTITFLMLKVTQQGTLATEVIDQWASSGTAAQADYRQATAAACELLGCHLQRH